MTRRANRYGVAGELPAFDAGKNVPVIALINPRSGAGAGSDILDVARRTPYYRNRFFDIITLYRRRERGGILDVFREELNAAKEEARRLGVRPRLISGGGDGTGSFALSVVFSALLADSARAEEGLRDTGNGFIWTDDELERFFPAIAQMPLGSANDFGNVLGWGQKFPGDEARSQAGMLECLQAWMKAVISPSSPIVNFDVWGIMPEQGKDRCDFKLCELTGNKGIDPRVQVDGESKLLMTEAGLPVPFLVCLYFSAGFGAEMVSRFQLNRKDRPWKNRLEYVKQAFGIMLQTRPAQVGNRLEGVEVECDGEQYFPPKKSDWYGNDKGGNNELYREVGFYNINWQAHMIHGADRAPACTRLCSVREPVTFNDGHVDMYRMKFRSFLKNPGPRFQVDKKRDMKLRFGGKPGQGLFFQWDGEARFAFSTSGKPFNIYVRKVLSIPVVLGHFFDPTITGDPDNGRPVSFQFHGETPQEREQVRRRVLQSVRGELDRELNATRAEMQAAGLPCDGN
jgi:diacylglycerol kinase family enzyme